MAQSYYLVFKQFYFISKIFRLFLNLVNLGLLHANGGAELVDKSLQTQHKKIL